MIKTIIFDNNGVLTTSDKEVRTVKNIFSSVGVYKKGAERIWELESKLVDIGKVTNREFLENFLERFGFKKEAVTDELMELYLKSYKPKADVQEFAKELRKKYELAMLTNFGKSFDVLYKKWGIDKIFDEEKIYVSCKIGMIKPNDDIYLYTLEKLNRRPEETVFIDDRSANIETARRLGMNGILFKNLEQLQKDLENVLE